MKDINSTKERIIEVTTGLIQESNGNVSEITARKIADGAGIGLGLINYHFGSKDQLITQCVQRIINNVVMCFSPDEGENEITDKERLASWAKQVFDFLFKNQAISRISILGDMENYHNECNSVLTQKGFSMAIRKDMDEGKKKLVVFMLTSAMQAAFLSGDDSKEILGYDLKVKKERDKYIDGLIEVLLGRDN